MAKVAIVGAGQLGCAVAKVLLSTTDNEVVIIDIDEDQLNACIDDCLDIQRPGHRIAFAPTIQLSPILVPEEIDYVGLFNELEPAVVVCATSPETTLTVAKAAAASNCHYLDFCGEDSMIAEIEKLQPSTTFIPGTGLAPGLATYIGTALFDKMDLPSSLNIRVGSLPQVSSGPLHYALPYSADDLARQILMPGIQKIDGRTMTVDSLGQLESLIVNSCSYEAFTAAEMFGSAKAFANIPSVSIKTIRYPGHLAALKKIVNRAAPLDEVVDTLNEKLFYTKDDLVIISAQAIDMTGFSSTSGIHFYPNRQLSLSATEFVAAGTVCGLIELILDDVLPDGVLTALDISFEHLMKTQAVSLIFENAS